MIIPQLAADGAMHNGFISHMTTPAGTGAAPRPISLCPDRVKRVSDFEIRDMCGSNLVGMTQINPHRPSRSGGKSTIKARDTAWAQA